MFGGARAWDLWVGRWHPKTNLPADRSPGGLYSGYKKAHTIKFQAIVTPDGMISHLGGPFEGKLGDWSACLESGIVDRLRVVNEGVAEGTELLVYGDPAYTSSYGVMGPFITRPNRPLTAAERELNTALGKLRQSVEYGFGKVLNLW